MPPGGAALTGRAWVCRGLADLALYGYGDLPLPPGWMQSRLLCQFAVMERPPDRHAGENGRPPSGPTLTCVYTGGPQQAQPLPAPQRRPDDAERTRADTAHAEIERRLLRGDFLLEERLGEERLASLVGVSRTPVREALLRLGAEGLVERHPDGGWRPVAPDLPSTRSLYEARRGLELQALARPVESTVPHDERLLRDLHAEWTALAERPPPAETEFVHRDEAFHLTLAEAAGNPALVELLALVNQRIRSVRMHDFLSEERVVATVEEHLGIVEAVLDGELEHGGLLLRRHVYESMSVVEDRVTHALQRMLASQTVVG